MVDRFRTILARFTTGHLRRPSQSVIRPWLWLASETDDTDEKRHCLEAVLQLNPESQIARPGLALLHQRQIRELDITSIANDGCQC